MAVLKCPGFQSESFRNGDSAEWNRRSKNIDEMCENHKLESGIKDLFFCLLAHGYCSSYDSDRIILVSTTLTTEGYSPLITGGWE